MDKEEEIELGPLVTEDPPYINKINSINGMKIKTIIKRYTSGLTYPNILVVVISAELVLGCIPILARMYGGDVYVDYNVTFWEFQVGQCNIRLLFSIVIILMAMVNSAIFISGGQFKAIWSKFSCLAIVATIEIMLRAGESRIEVLGLSCLLAVSAFLTPAFTDSIINTLLTLLCYVIATWYAFITRMINIYTVQNSIMVMLFGLFTPLFVLTWAVLSKTGLFSVSPKGYLMFELGLVCYVIVMAIIPN